MRKQSSLKRNNYFTETRNEGRERGEKKESQIKLSIFVAFFLSLFQPFSWTFLRPLTSKPEPESKVSFVSVFFSWRPPTNVEVWKPQKSGWKWPRLSRSTGEQNKTRGTRRFGSTVKSCLLFRFDWGERRERDRETETETECVCKCERDKIGDKHTP
jgi:hypothetical protein